MSHWTFKVEIVLKTPFQSRFTYFLMHTGWQTPQSLIVKPRPKELSLSVENSLAESRVSVTRAAILRILHTVFIGIAVAHICNIFIIFAIA